jgi:hypothetical protein
MPKNATLAQRVRWHRAHAKHCACRPVPAPLMALIKKSELRMADRARARSGRKQDS